MPRGRTTDLQIRGVPVALRDRLRKRAAGKGVSMSQYVTELLDEDLAFPTIDEWLAEVAALPKLELPEDWDSVAEVHAARDEMEEEFERKRSSSTRRSP